jgi:hypothetical protein
VTQLSGAIANVQSCVMAGCRSIQNRNQAAYKETPGAEGFRGFERWCDLCYLVPAVQLLEIIFTFFTLNVI